MNAVTPEERRLIDEAIAQGKVQKVPPGSGHPGFQWCESRQRLVTKENDGGRSYFTFGWRTSKRQVVAKKRRAHVRRLHGEGKTVAEIVEALGASEYSIRADHSVLDLKPNPPKRAMPQHAKGMKPYRAKRIERVKDLYARGLSKREIADALSVSVRTVRSDLSDIGLVKIERFDAAKIKKRRNDVVEMYRRGDAVIDIARAVKASVPCIYKDLRKMKVQLRSDSAPGRIAS